MPSRKYLFIALAGALAALALYLIVKIATDRFQQITTPLGKELSAPAKITNLIKPQSPLAKVVEGSLQDAAGTYAVVVKNLGTGQEYNLNENREFTSASLYKLWVMATAFEQIKAGTLKEDEVLTKTEKELNEIQEIKTEEEPRGSISMTVEKAIESMIIVSDNNAAVLLTERLGHQKITAFLQNHNFSSSSYNSPPRATAGDMAALYEKLARGEIINRQSSDKMLALLYRQRLNDRIPKYLPEGVKVAHKTGELEGFKHDAGIVSTLDGDYIIVVLTETGDAQEAAEKIALLSKAVFDFMSENSK